jgi:transposase
MAATVAATEPRIEIVGERRRAYDAEFRARLVQASFVPGARVRDLAQQHGVCVSLIYRWRRSAPARTASNTRSKANGPTADPATAAGERAVEFVPIGMFGRAADEGPALIAGPPIGTAPAGSGSAAPSRPAMEARPGLIEIDLPDGTRLRVDAFVNERALRRVLAVLKAAV